MLLCYHQFRVGGPQSPFSISSSFILFFVSLPFFLKTKLPGWRPSIAFLYLFLFHSLLLLTSFLSQNQTSGLATLNRLSQSLPLSFSSSSHFLSFSKPNFRVGDPQSPFSISSSFIVFFVSLPFFLKTKIPGWRPSIAILYLFLFHSLLRLTSFLSQNQTSGLATLNRHSLSLPLSFSSSSHFLSFSKPKFRVGDPQSPFSISSSFILLFASLPFFLKTNSISNTQHDIEYVLAK